MSKERAASQTAMLIASLRALACFEEDLAVRGSDTLAEIFLPEDKRQPLHSPQIRSMIKKAVPEGLYEYVTARTKFFDELFVNCLDSGFDQIVLLGAGYDSRAARFRDKSPGTVIYEVDAPATQQEKRRILEESGVSLPGSMVFVPVDFETDDLFGSLAVAGYDPAARTLFAWEGVTFYLSPRAVDDMLEAIRKNAAPGSLLGFDFQHIDLEHGLIDTQLQSEQIKFGLDVAQCAAYLKKFGFSLKEMLDAKVMADRFLTMSNGGRLGAINPVMHIALAELAE